MSTVRSVITGSLRKIGVVGGVGRRSPSNTEFADALGNLVSLYRALITAGTFGRMHDVVPTGDYVAGENQRVFRRHNDQQTILLPDLVSTCGTCGYLACDLADTPTPPSMDYGRKAYVTRSTDRRTIRDNAVVTLVDEFSGDILEAIYDGQRKLWFTITDLDLREELDEDNEWSVKRLNDVLDMEAPLSHRNANGLSALLATHLADEYAAEVPAQTERQALAFRSSLTSNHSFYKPEDDCGSVVSTTPAVGFYPVEMPVTPAPSTEGVIYIDRAGTTPVSVAGTAETDLLFIVEGGFTLASVGNTFFFTSAQAISLGTKRHQWAIKDVSSDQVLDRGAIEATGFAV